MLGGAAGILGEHSFVEPLAIRPLVYDALQAVDSVVAAETGAPVEQPLLRLLFPQAFREPRQSAERRGRPLGRGLARARLMVLLVFLLVVQGRPIWPVALANLAGCSGQIGRLSR